MLDTLTMIEKKHLFRLERQYPMPYEKFDNTWVSITIERALDDSAISFISALNCVSTLDALSLLVITKQVGI